MCTLTSPSRGRRGADESALHRKPFRAPAFAGVTWNLRKPSAQSQRHPGGGRDPDTIPEGTARCISGNGREWGRFGLEEYLEVKAIGGWGSDGAPNVCAARKCELRRLQLEAALDAIDPQLQPVDLGILHSLVHVIGSDMSLDRAEPHRELLNRSFNAIQTSPDVSEVLKHHVARVFGHEQIWSGWRGPVKNWRTNNRSPPDQVPPMYLGSQLSVMAARSARGRASSPFSASVVPPVRPMMRAGSASRRARSITSSARSGSTEST